MGWKAGLLLLSIALLQATACREREDHPNDTWAPDTVAIHDVADTHIPDASVDSVSPQDTAQDTRQDTIAPPQDTPIYALQDPSVQGPPLGTEVMISGVVTAVDTYGDITGFWVQEPEGGPFSGVFVYNERRLQLNQLQRGDEVRVRGTYVEYHGVTEVDVHEFVIDANGTAPEPLSVTTLELLESDETFEGVLVQVCGSCDVQAALDFNELETTCARLDDEIAPLNAQPGDNFSCMTGIWHYSYNRFKLLPRDAQDLVSGTGCGQCGPCSVVVAEVIDGDTVVIVGGERLRYIGVDTPEITSNECYSHEATAFNEQMVLLKEVRLEYDTTCRDPYDRLLAYVYAGDTMVNQELIEQGYGEVMMIAPNDRYRDLFNSLEAAARAANRGLWGACY